MLQNNGGSKLMEWSALGQGNQRTEWQPKQCGRRKPQKEHPPKEDLVAYHLKTPVKVCQDAYIEVPSQTLKDWQQHVNSVLVD